ncbi:MAG: histidine kinase dimerization/phosphoacceptor domain-containing protein [Saprospiraceae bacterium]|nr:histidine kinase dimerization/phosphoacceptor domain-containing protein [Saprospiraceae bacterium]
MEGQETERLRIAKDLYDGLGGLLTTIKAYFSSIQKGNPTTRKTSIFIIKHIN